jgi:hypothetical protein
MPATAAKKTGSASSSLSLGGFLWAPGISSQRFHSIVEGESRGARTGWINPPLIGSRVIPRPGMWPSGNRACQEIAPATCPASYAPAGPGLALST